MAASLATQLATTQQYMSYFMIVYVVFGNIGNFLNCLVFLRRKFRSNSCSCYLLVGSIANIFVLTFLTTFAFYPLQQYDPTNYLIAYCKFRAYIGHATINISRTLIVLACFDRACVSSSKVWMRNLGRAKVAWKITGVCVVSWFVIAFHMGTFNSIINGKCTRSYVYGLFFSIYSFILIGTTPLVLMIVFSAMTLHNIKIAHNRVQPQPRSTGMRQRDFHLVRMLIAEVVVYIISTFPFPVQLFYVTVTMPVNKSADRIAIEGFISYLTTGFFIYLNQAAPFYIFYATSKTFRVEFKETMKNIYYRVFRRPQPRETSLETTRTMVNELW